MKRILLSALCLAASSSFAAITLAADKPNILLIVADDLGYSDTSTFGGEIPTPALDSLAADGIRLTNFQAAPTCSVTRAGLLSGVDHHQSGVGTMAEDVQPEQKGKPGYEGYLNFRVASLAELLQKGGYHTYMAGKWHLGGAKELSPSARGFEHSYALMPGASSHLDDMRTFFPGNQKALYREDGNEVDVPKGFYSSAFYTDKLIDYIGKNHSDGKPFFAYAAYTSPHWPLQVPEPELDKFKGKYAAGYEAIRQARMSGMIQKGIMPVGTKANAPMNKDLPSWDELTPEQQRIEARKMELYAAMVSNLDGHIGRLVKYLESIGEMDNTLVLFMSDNGAEGTTTEALENADWVRKSFDNSYENMGKRNSFVYLGPQWGQVAETPFPYFKGFATRGGVNVPAIVRYPKLGNAGQNNNQMLSVLDFVPTVLELAGMQYPQKLDGRELLPLQGRSMLPALEGKAVAERGLGWELYGHRAYRKGDWQVVKQVAPYGTGEWELYDLAKDPTSLHNLAAQNPGKVAELAAGWEQYAKDNGVILAPARIKYTFVTCEYGRCVN